MSTPSLWRHADFLKLWTGQTVSRLGSVVTRTALPLVALLVLGAGPREMAYLVIAGSAGVLLVGLFAGAWVDRLRRRPLLVWTDVIRAGLLFGVGAYVFWGLMPLYFERVMDVPPLELLAQRIVWSLVLLAALITFLRRWSEVRRCLPA